MNGSPRSPSRRRFFKFALGGTLAFGAVGAAPRSVDTYDLETTSSHIRLANLAPQFENYRIAFLSDIHLGPFVPDDYLASVIDEVNNQRVDLVLLGGDYIGIPDSYPARLFKEVEGANYPARRGSEIAELIFRKCAQVLGSAKAHDGIFGVLGNHDHWNNSGLCKKHFVGPIRLLVNELATIRRGSALLEIVGVDDLWTGVPRLSQAQKAFRPEATRVLVSHNPDYIERVVQASVARFDLALAGHTHGGQIKLPLFGPLIGYNVRSTILNEGPCRVRECHAHVSRGIGVVDIPLRLNCRPELTVLELVRA
ncbi:MAG: metallophosphoesterase [Deltaproteobacteria bacterium]|nr:metallophosphoesterase [Deltaproteobacteria bacterium]